MWSVLRSSGHTVPTRPFIDRASDDWELEPSHDPKEVLKVREFAFSRRHQPSADRVPGDRLAEAIPKTPCVIDREIDSDGDAQRDMGRHDRSLRRRQAAVHTLSRRAV